VNYFDQDEEFKDVLSLEGLVAIDPNERDLLACMGFADTKEAPLVNYIYYETLRYTLSNRQKDTRQRDYQKMRKRMSPASLPRYPICF
jgi:hypothetical protein